MSKNINAEKYKRHQIQIPKYGNAAKIQLRKNNDAKCINVKKYQRRKIQISKKQTPKRPDQKYTGGNGQHRIYK